MVAEKYLKNAASTLGVVILLAGLVSCDIFGVHDPYHPRYPCEDGIAKETYPCRNIDLVALLSPDQLGGDHLNDIWGWRDARTRNRYALVGLNNGVSIVDITHPPSPRVMGRLPSHPLNHDHPDHPHTSSSRPEQPTLKHGDSDWGDIKVYRNHMYAVSEERGHGVHVFDLSRLRTLDPDSSRIFTVDTVYHELSTAHNIAINSETGYAYAVGTDGNTCGGSGLHIINIQQPTSPSHAGCFNESGYIHDTQCVVYRGPDEDYQNRELCFNSNADKFSIADVSDKANPQLVSKLRYEGIGYAHQGWLTEDHRYFLLGDEFDELQNEHPLRTYILDVRDLDNPSLLSYHETDISSIDHNLFVKENHVYQSNYTNGISILELDNIDQGQLKRVAHFDTYPLNDRPEFSGTWSNYPFFKDGLLIASDISGGLFILRTDLD